jgi:hypothetical protein
MSCASFRTVVNNSSIMLIVATWSGGSRCRFGNAFLNAVVAQLQRHMLRWMMLCFGLLQQETRNHFVSPSNSMAAVSMVNS